MNSDFSKLFIAALFLDLFSDATTFLEKIFTYTFQSEFTGDEDHNEIQARATFNPELFFYVLLPPIIFFAGYGMHR